MMDACVQNQVLALTKGREGVGDPIDVSPILPAVLNIDARSDLLP